MKVLMADRGNPVPYTEYARRPRYDNALEESGAGADPRPFLGFFLLRRGREHGFYSDRRARPDRHASSARSEVRDEPLLDFRNPSCKKRDMALPGL
jgi:hypothetical protein